MSSPARQYASGVFRHLGKHVSGWVIACISIASLVTSAVMIHQGVDAQLLNGVLTWTAVITVVALFAIFFVAQYDVWREERTARLRAEDELNASAPDIQGTIWVSLSPTNPYADQTRVGSSLRFNCDCSNHGRAACELNKVAVEIVPPDGHRFEIISQLSQPYFVDKGRAFVFQADELVAGVSPEDLRRSDITIHLEDSLGRRYPNTVTKRSPALFKPSKLVTQLVT